MACELNSAGTKQSTEGASVILWQSKLSVKRLEIWLICINTVLKDKISYVWKWVREQFSITKAIIIIIVTQTWAKNIIVRFYFQTLSSLERDWLLNSLAFPKLALQEDFNHSHLISIVITQQWNKICLTTKTGPSMAYMGWHQGNSIRQWNHISQ